MVVELVRNYWWAAIMPAFGIVGYYLDKQQNYRYSGWKNRTQLYKRELKEGEDPWTSKS